MKSFMLSHATAMGITLLALAACLSAGSGCSASGESEEGRHVRAPVGRVGTSEISARSFLPQDPEPELRGVFVTTAYNLDWPTRPGLHWRAQRDEINAIVDRVSAMNCNVIFLQVRAFGDRIHRPPGIPNPNRAPEPWSQSLSLRQDPHGQKQKYDPLAEWIHAAHEKGIELHLWINPFRVDGMVKYKGKDLDLMPTQDERYLYLHPNSQDVQDYVIDVVQELIGHKNRHTMPRNPIALGGISGFGGLAALILLMDGDGGPDGVLIDHNLPPEPGDTTTVPSTGPSTGPSGAADGAAETLSASAEETVVLSAALQPTSGQLTPPGETSLERKRKRIEWLMKKRHGAGHIPPKVDPQRMDDFIQRLFQTCDSAGVKLGISPERHDEAPKRWLGNGWAHYFVPELYVRMKDDQDETEFKGWLDDWLSANTFSGSEPTQPRKVVIAPGLFSTRVQTPDVNEDATWAREEIQKQILVARDAGDENSKAQGQAFYGWSALRSQAHGGPESSNNLGDLMPAAQLDPSKNLYVRRVRIPAMGGGEWPVTPIVEMPGGKPTWRLSTPAEMSKVRFWAVWEQAPDESWREMRIVRASITAFDPDPNNPAKAVAVKAIDGLNRASRFGRSQ